MRILELTIIEKIDYEPTKNVRFRINLEEIDSLPTSLKGVALEQILTFMKERIEDDESNSLINLEVKKDAKKNR